MRVRFDNPTEKSALMQYNNGIVPRFGRGTMSDVAWCNCGMCCGQVLTLANTDNFIGWIETECDCGNKIDWSRAHLPV